MNFPIAERPILYMKDVNASFDRALTRQQDNGAWFCETFRIDGEIVGQLWVFACHNTIECPDPNCRSWH